MEVVQEDRKAEQVDPEGRGKTSQVVLDPDLAVVEIISRQRILAKEEAPSHGTREDVSDGDFIGIKDF